MGASEAKLSAYGAYSRRGAVERHPSRLNSGPALSSLFAEQCRLDVRTPLPGKRGGKTREVASLGPQVRPAARRSTHDASALALDATRRARRGVTFSESTADSNSATVTDFQCQKVGDPTLVQPKYHPNPRVQSLVSFLPPV